MYKSRFDSPSNPSCSAGSSPRPRAEELAVRNGLQGDTFEVGRVEVNRITPPVQLPTSTGENESEEDEETRHSEAEVESD